MAGHGTCLNACHKSALTLILLRRVRKQLLSGRVRKQLPGVNARSLGPRSADRQGLEALGSLTSATLASPCGSDGSGFVGRTARVVGVPCRLGPRRRSRQCVQPACPFRLGTVRRPDYGRTPGAPPPPQFYTNTCWSGNSCATSSWYRHRLIDLSGSGRLMGDTRHLRLIEHSSIFQHARRKGALANSSPPEGQVFLLDCLTSPALDRRET
jgi:hypothetical protein